MLILLLFKTPRPIFIDMDQYGNSLSKKKSYERNVQKYLHFNDIIYTAIDMKENSQSIIELIKLMKNEVHSLSIED